MTGIEALVQSRSLNATVTWSLVVALAVDVVASLYVGAVLWAAFSLAVVAVAVLPTVLLRDGSVVVSWRPLVLAAIPVAARWADLFVRPMAYLSVAALALLVAVEVDVFSPVEMPPWFAVLFVTLTTLTVAGLWGILQYASDVALGTAFVAGREALMWELVGATGVGVAAGVVFYRYFHEDGPAPSAAGEVGH